MAVTRDYYKVMYIGPPGGGKTYSFRDMDSESTGFINAENKPLPFAATFKYHARPKKFAGATKALEDYAKNPDIKVIIIDSLSAVFEMLLEEMRNNFRGFDVWDNYNRSVAKFIRQIKEAEKEVFVTCHYEVLNIEGAPEKRAKTKGKEWEGLIEKEFTIVLYADKKFRDDKPEYFFRTTGEGLSAKCPPDIFGEGVIKIPEDSRIILDKVVAFAKKSEITVDSSKESIFA